MYELTVRGLVQGVGYRPFVIRLCSLLGLDGDVRNSGGIVKIRLNCDKKTAEELKERLFSEYPAGARIDTIEIAEIPEKLFSGFSFAVSDDETMLPLLPADIGICEECRRELFDVKSRFYRYPFISCAACGPRYTIMRATPYDRENTSMDEFPMCGDCRREYETSKAGNRRFYAQTIACEKCGPSLWWKEGGEKNTAKGSPSTKTRESNEYFYACAVKELKKREVIAVKDIGGYHLVCDAFSEIAVEKLRAIKKREDKPFAVMVKSAKTAEKYAFVNEREKALLESPARPIVLLDRKEKNFNKVCKNSPDIGIMLPAGGLQCLLAADFEMLVMTSANLSGEPMITDDEEIERLGVSVLGNDREILTPADDSVVRVLCGRTQFLRRSRGYVPEPIEIAESEKTKELKSVFAAGADMRSAFAFAAGNRVYFSQYLGDLSKLRVQKEYMSTLKRMGKMHRISDGGNDFGGMITVKSDLHPAYVSARLGKRAEEEIFRGSDAAGETEIIKVQHHIAHAAAAAAEHGIEDEALCFVFDGTGYGLDKTIWGGEVFCFDGKDFLRIDHLKTVALIGGDEGVRNTGLILAGYIYAARQRGLLNDIADTDIYSVNGYFEQGAEKLVYKALELGINTVFSSSCGRLFDAVSALLGICAYSHYEGQAACEFEYMARAYAASGKISTEKAEIPEVTDCFLDGPALIAHLAGRRLLGAGAGELAYEFHEILAYSVLKKTEEFFAGERNLNTAGQENKKSKNSGYSAEECSQADSKTKGKVLLSGGCFANRLLTELTMEKLSDAGFSVYINEKIPPGDDGIALGQIFA